MLLSLKKSKKRTSTTLDQQPTEDVNIDQSSYLPKSSAAGAQRTAWRRKTVTKDVSTDLYSRSPELSIPRNKIEKGVVSSGKISTQPEPADLTRGKLEPLTPSFLPYRLSHPLLDVRRDLLSLYLLEYPPNRLSPLSLEDYWHL